MLVPVAAPSKVWACGLSLARIGASNPAGGTEVSRVIVVCLQVEVSATGSSLVCRSPTDCGVSECDRENSIRS